MKNTTFFGIVKNGETIYESRNGVWSLAALEALALRKGGTLKYAYSLQYRYGSYDHYSDRRVILNHPADC